MKFDKNNEYGSYVIVHSKDKIEEAKKAIQENMKLNIPEEFWDFVTFPVSFHKTIGIKVKEDNYEMIGAKKEEIGQILDIPEHWTVGWMYSPLRRTG